MATSTLTAAATPSAASVKNPQLKRVVYSKYRELLGSYNDKANAIIETLPAYMVREDRGFQLELPMAVHCNDKSSADIYGQRGGGAVGGGGYEAPACVQNAMMTKDKKPFTYTPGGIDLSQIRSERMAKRLARNAQAEGAGTGAAQQNRPSPQSPGGNVASSMGAAAMGMPFQVLPPPPPPQPQSGKNGNHAAPTAAPPPPPPQQSTLAPPGRGSAPGSPATTRKSPTPQRFEPPPLGFRPEIKIPSNPMAALRKVPPPVEKNTFWKDEYCKERSKSPLPESTQNPNANGYNSSNNNNNNNNNSYDAVDGEQRETIKPTNGGSNNYSNGNDNNNSINSYSPYTPTQVQQQQPQQQQLHQQSQQPQSPSPKTPPLQQQQQQWQPTPPATPPQQTRQEFRSVPMPTSPAVNVYTRQSDSPRSPFEQQHQQQQQERATESPFRFAQMQQQLQQQQQLQRPPAAVSPLAQPQQKPRPPTAVSPLTHPQQSRSPTAISPLAQQQPQQQQQQPQASSSVPWRTQRTPQQQQQQQHPQPIYNNVQQQQQQPSQQQRSRDIFSPAKTEQIQQSYDNQESQYQGAKPTNVGSLYIAPLQQPVEPQAQRLLLQQQQQSGARDSPMRQLPQQQQQQQPQQIGGQPLRWLSSQPQAKEQAPWARPEENGNVMPSSLRQPAQSAGATQVQPTTGYYQPQPQPQPQQVVQGNGYGTSSSPGQTSQHNFGSNAQQSGLRLQINTNSISNNASQTGPRERIIPITLEQTPTYAAAQPNFGGYNNYPASATAQQQFVSNNNNNNNIVNSNGNNNSTRIIPIAIEGGRGGPVSQSPVILQNGNYNLYVHQCPLEAEILFRKNRLSDPRSPPIQSKSFRILQKITDTVDDGSGSDGRQDSPQSTRQTQLDVEPPQLQRPQFARQMSAQQARNSPTIEQMRRLQIAQDQQSGTPTVWSPQGNGVSTQNRFTPQRSLYDSSQQPQQQQFIPASEQQAPEPKKYTGSAIPSRSFKILQAMTTPENAGPGQSDL
ncbi:putative mediator of RNA polymerase II transcription subunit 26 isoform X3 [Drosophila albomicans]|uniref:Mediator of RNA polymerase II transcription subunit 26 isoform X3 n=1 Tax=Drosophila albomicans TaxID=7291 RepID=A0A9C6SZJ6_DROAB|nr:putative mediator of RNA polymerase II transcription subunit 26 isoform X3 [Drosophila albomicans]